MAKKYNSCGGINPEWLYNRVRRRELKELAEEQYVLTRANLEAKMDFLKQYSIQPTKKELVIMAIMI